MLTAVMHPTGLKTTEHVSTLFIIALHHTLQLTQQ